jgi:hypothetical protein
LDRQEEIMELPGSAYLYTLATLSMTFAGFSAVVIVLCQTIGREISGFHVVLMRLYIEAGLWAAGFCMLAPLLAAFGLSEATVWRATSAIIAMIINDATPCDDDGTVASRTMVADCRHFDAGGRRPDRQRCWNSARARGRASRTRCVMDVGVRGRDLHFGAERILGTQGWA